MSETVLDLDPAAPLDGAVTAEAVRRANLGDPTEPSEEGPAPDLGHPANLTVDRQCAQDFLNACMTSHPRVRYGLGAKIKPHGVQPGTDFTAVDCSGFVRELIWRATSPHFEFMDGSVVQHDWVKAQGFLTTSIEDGKKTDDKVRIAFLSPRDSGEGIGHVVLVHNGRTLESHGGAGPSTRQWTGTGWQAHASVYILDGHVAV